MKRVSPTPRRPHGIAYSLTLHDPRGRRLMGFDNAHAPQRGHGYTPSPIANDHWHRTENDKGRPYVFRSALQRVQDFLDEVERILGERGVPAVMIAHKDQDDV